MRCSDCKRGVNLSNARNPIEALEQFIVDHYFYSHVSEIIISFMDVSNECTHTHTKQLFCVCRGPQSKRILFFLFMCWLLCGNILVNMSFQLIVMLLSANWFRFIGVAILHNRTFLAGYRCNFEWIKCILYIDSTTMFAISSLIDPHIIFFSL